MKPTTLTLLVILSALAGCVSNGGSGQLTGPAHASGSITIVSADVQDGTLRSVTIKNNATSPTVAVNATLELAGTSSGHPARYNTSVQLPSLGANQTQVVDITGAPQPDWQDGTELTIKLTTGTGDSAEITIRTV